MTTVVVATRSPNKLGEITRILPPIEGLRLIDLQSAGIPEDPEEDTVEVYTTFEGNALAKARYFAERTEFAVLADDSGLSVDALDGAPGVRSRRFSGRTDLSGPELDRANNEALLSALAEVPTERRTARFHCAIAIVHPGGDSRCFEGDIEGVILTEPRGGGGFGYDPLFFVSELGSTLAEVPADLKNSVSHRARALAAAVPYLRELASQPLR